MYPQGHEFIEAIEPADMYDVVYEYESEDMLTVDSINVTFTQLGLICNTPEEPYIFDFIDYKYILIDTKNVSDEDSHIIEAINRAAPENMQTILSQIS